MGASILNDMVKIVMSWFVLVIEICRLCVRCWSIFVMMKVLVLMVNDLSVRM